MAVTSWPASARVRAAGSPRMMLTSCSGDGPPKITAGWLTVGSSLSSWIMVWKIVFVQDGVAGPAVLPDPRHCLFPGVDQDNRHVAACRSLHQGPPVGVADDEEVGAGAAGHGGGETGVLLGLARPE